MLLRHAAQKGAGAAGAGAAEKGKGEGPAEREPPKKCRAHAARRSGSGRHSGVEKSSWTLRTGCGWCSADASSTFSSPDQG